MAKLTKAQKVLDAGNALAKAAYDYGQSDGLYWHQLKRAALAYAKSKGYQPPRKGAK